MKRRRVIKLRLLSMTMKSIGFFTIVIRNLTNKDWVIFVGALLMLAGWYALDLYYFSRETITTTYPIPSMWERYGINEKKSIHD